MSPMGGPQGLPKGGTNGAKGRNQARAAIQPRVAFYAIRYILALILPNDRVKNMPLQKSIFWASGSATKQFQKNRLVLTFGQVLIVLASFTNKNMIMGQYMLRCKFKKIDFC